MRCLIEAGQDKTTQNIQNHKQIAVSYTHLDVYKRQEYNGVYYTLSETRMPFKADKTVDEDYFILTLFSLALEAKERGITLSGKDIVLGVGLPPADLDVYKRQYDTSCI